MRIGIPREIKAREGRVALVPAACAELVRAGHEVRVQSGAGLASGYADAAYAAVGAHIVADAPTLYAESTLIVKVKEPVADDLPHLRADHRLFCFLHLAAERELAVRLRDIGLTALAFETLRDGGGLPLLAPMSEIAGKLSVQVGTHLLHQPMGGRGLLLGGLAGAERGHVVVIGAGVAGGAAAGVAAALGARVTVFDLLRERLSAMRALAPSVSGLHPYVDAMAEAVADADLLIGAVLVPGRHAPRLVTRETVRGMRPGSVIADISVDQGGCIETTRPTSYDAPTYVDEGVQHFCVTNMPGGVPRSSTQALSAALLPYVLRLAGPEWERDAALMEAVNLCAGRYVHPAIRAEFEGGA
ncbi:MAG: alanine dehydrogenase [Ectothiorhodospiraceae bacterium]|jgi:alanine dehydrogenase|nr:alanine dehydrogenase [Ectothiorhodospiraceae bacterium]